ncbi:MAG: 4-hydroxy-3-methylbut-2-enyl diphosphate reductase [Candidatus Cloacimonetes bacterium]|nr:4-hydroxy-3-methylbut-2-enyl diphosphate reductase [Candidatus Cloacimonadota bacterium]
MGKTLLLASPRGFCAGVTRAIEIVERALQLWGSPVYVKHEIVHNRHVVDRLRAKGAIFVEELEEIPAGSKVIFSAHGVPPDTFSKAESMSLDVTDATCPLVTKVHKEAYRYASEDMQILLIGHKNHVEAIGTQGVAKERTTIIETPEDARTVSVANPDKVAVLTQTTLSVDDTKEILDILISRFPKIHRPGKSDICYATTNRQVAIREIGDSVDLVLVVGATNSSNSNRLREVASRNGVPAYLIQDESQIETRWLDGVNTIGMTAGASTPEDLVERCVSKLREYGVTEVKEHISVEERVTFGLPRMD